MRVAVHRALVMAALSTVAACQLSSTGLGSADAGRTIALTDAASTGAAGAGATGGVAAMSDVDASAIGGAGGDTGVAGGGGGDAGNSGGPAGSSGGAGGDGGDTGGVGGVGGVGGLGGSGGAGGVPSTAQGGAGGAPDAGSVGGMQGVPDAHPSSPVGCADGSREGFTDLQKYPNIAACSGGWQTAGFVAPETLTPQCARRAGNDGAVTDGAGCSVADLCAEGWHVCESIREFTMNSADCKDALSAADGEDLFFATRQHGPMITCDPANLTGTNNVYGCGNFGSAAAAACAPFTRMLRDADCKANPPWMCVDGPINDSVTELVDMTKPGSAHGGVMCCR